MGYLTAKQFAEKWGISERRIIKLCKEERIKGAIKSGMFWEIPEEALKPSDKRSNIYKYINVEKRILIVNIEGELKEYLLELIKKEGYVAEFKGFAEIRNNLEELEKYYEDLIYFPTNNIDKSEEDFIINFSRKLNLESNIVIVDYDADERNKIEQKLCSKLKKEIGLRINAITLDVSKQQEVIINYSEIAEDIMNLITNFKNTTGVEIKTDGGKIEFDKRGKTKKLEEGEFYRAINNCFNKLTKNSYLWCASTMLEDEWTEAPQEMKFRVINLEVANRGVKVERIFIFGKSKIKEFKQNKTLKIYMQSNIKTLFVDYDEIKEKNPKLLNIVGSGWDGIDKTTLILDLPEQYKERGYISKNTREVWRAYKCFQELKKYSKNLKEILK